MEERGRSGEEEERWRRRGEMEEGGRSGEGEGRGRRRGEVAEERGGGGGCLGEGEGAGLFLDGGYVVFGSQIGFCFGPKSLLCPPL